MKAHVSFLLLSIFISGLKILLLPTYHSTDFEVHRNWLAITNSLPLKDWYFCEHSQWSLDYPPFFAYFEFALSQLAAIVSSDLVTVSSSSIATEAVIIFQRLSVVFTDLLLLWATYRLLVSSGLSDAPARTEGAAVVEVEHADSHFNFNKVFGASSRSLSIFLLVGCHAGLLLVDHIHFQYNGMLMGLLLFCLDCAFRKHHVLLAAAFSTLVLMKHLFAPLAPVFAVYLISCHCFVPATDSTTTAPARGKHSFSLMRLTHLAFVAAVAVLLALAPFIAHAVAVDQSSPNGFFRVDLELVQEQLSRMATQLFPFGRGLVHAYWAPNFWALYCFVDKILSIVFPGLVLSITGHLPSSSSGLVGDFHFSVLPSVPASLCLLLVLLAQFPAIYKVAVQPTPRTLLRAIMLSSLSTFMFGYHVHEKAFIAPSILLAIMATDGSQEAGLFLQLTAAGVVGLFPLLEGRRELPIKWVLTACYLRCAYLVVVKNVLLSSLYKWYLWLMFLALLGLSVFCEVLHPLLFTSESGEVRLPFLPLLLTSVSCAVLLFMAWVQASLLVWRCKV